MAGVELVSSNAPAQEAIRRTSEVKVENTTKTIEPEQVQKVKEPDHHEELENVVARSEDGDTVQVSDDGAEELVESREGAVVAETEEPVAVTRPETDFEIEAPEIVEIETPEIEIPEETTEEVDGPPFSGYTSQELQALYQQGMISAYTYNNEVERREAILEAAMGENEEINEEISGISAASNRLAQADFAIETAVNSESKISLDDRLDAVNSTIENEKTQARITEEAGKLWDYQLRA